MFIKTLNLIYFFTNNPSLQLRPNNINNFLCGLNFQSWYFSTVLGYKKANLCLRKEYRCPCKTKVSSKWLFDLHQKFCFRSVVNKIFSHTTCASLQLFKRLFHSKSIEFSFFFSIKDENHKNNSQTSGFKLETKSPIWEQ